MWDDSAESIIVDETKLAIANCNVAIHSTRAMCRSHRLLIPMKMKLASAGLSNISASRECLYALRLALQWTAQA